MWFAWFVWFAWYAFKSYPITAQFPTIIIVIVLAVIILLFIIGLLGMMMVMKHRNNNNTQEVTQITSTPPSEEIQIDNITEPIEQIQEQVLFPEPRVVSGPRPRLGFTGPSGLIVFL